MLVYRPSRGNDTVGLTNIGEWTGVSIGREVIIRDKFGPQNYFSWTYSDLNVDSNWFYKPLTDLDFKVGSYYYRCLYIGPHENENVQEYVGTVGTSTLSCTTSSTSATSDIQISLGVEGIFTKDTSKLSIALDNELDTTNKLQNITFSPSITINNTLNVGQWLKVWVKIDVPINLSLVDIENLCYFYNIGSLSIQINKEKNRLSTSNIFQGKLLNSNLVVKELIPKDNNISSIAKVINVSDNQSHIFYTDTSGAFNDLVVYKINDVLTNKYINVDLSPLVSSISGFNINSNNLSVFKDYFICDQFEYGKKYIVDIFNSNIENKRYFYIFYNELFKKETTTIEVSGNEYNLYDLNYGHELYYWRSGVLVLNLNNFSSEMFETVDAGYSNKLESTNFIGNDYTLKEDYIITSLSMQDDLFTMIGYSTENSNQTPLSGSIFCIKDKNYFTNLMFVWEKDILLDSINPQMVKTPELSKIYVVNERSNKDSQLVIPDINSINVNDLYHYKKIYTIKDISLNNIKWCDFGSPHSNKLKHYNDANLYIDTPTPHNDFSATISFRLPVIDTTSYSFIPYSQTNAIHNHILYTSDVQDISSSICSTPLVRLPYSISGDIELISVSIKNSDVTPFSLIYDTVYSNYIFKTVDVSGNIVTTSVSGSLYLMQENVISLNVFRNPVYGDNCIGKQISNFDIYINGQFIKSLSSYVLGTFDSLILNYNPKKQFSGSVSYIEMKPYVNNPVTYFNNMYNIHTNIAWSFVGKELDNTNNSNTLLQFYKNKRNIKLNNISVCKDSIIIPITLQGASYSFDKTWQEYNNKALRTSIDNVNKSTFDFSKLNLNIVDIAFTKQGQNELLNWSVDQYNMTNDTLTIWVRLPNYNKENITLYYNSQRIDANAIGDLKNAFIDNYGTWTMDAIISTYGYRFKEQTIFNAGENIIYLENDNNKFAVQIDYQYMYGYTKLYKSNKFDILYDDRKYNIKQNNEITDFIKSSVGEFKPDYMSVRNISSKYNYILDTNNYPAT